MALKIAHIGDTTTIYGSVFRFDPAEDTALDNALNVTGNSL